MKGTMLGRLSLLAFVGAWMLAVFLAGMYVQRAEVLPLSVRSAHEMLAASLRFWHLTDRSGGVGVAARPAPRGGAGQTLCIDSEQAASLSKLQARAGMPMLLCPAGAPRGEAEARRVEFVAGEQLADPVLFKGEVGTFLDQCPRPWGCVAVEYSRTGTVRRSWPLLPEAIAAANIAPESRYPYIHPIGWSFPRAIRQGEFQISPYPDGDLLVVFVFGNSTPYGGGVARLAPDGSPRWYRKDFSHHWPHVVDDDLALVPGLRLERTRVSFKLANGEQSQLRCRDSLILEDLVNLVDGRGTVLKEIRVLDAIVQSRWASTLASGVSACNPTHLNFVHMLGDDARGTPGIAPGDLVISLRMLDAFGILDGSSFAVKRLIRGSFRRQHGVRHLEKARFVVFDNLGAGPAMGPSRLMIVDLATGEEKTIFPTDATPTHLRRFFYFDRGQFDVSPDRQRVVLADRAAGRAFEIRIRDGKLLNVFHHIHDVSSQAGFPAEMAGNAWLFSFHGIHYARGPS